MNIVSILKQIHSGEIVWGVEKIEKLMDSIMRGYPIGLVLMWETFNDIQYRKFESAYKPGNRPSFFDNTSNSKLRVVLDGQQRLQSLYLALYGHYNNKYLYFDIMSGLESDDFKEEKYYFYFADSNEAGKWNEDSESSATSTAKNENGLEYYSKVSDLFKMNASEKQKYRRRISKLLNLDDEDELRLETNLSIVDEVLAKDQNILKASIIDEDKPSNSGARQNESDVLEIFVRINRQGTPLSRSDLIFSMLKLNWKESATALPDFVDEINEGNSFDIDIDFVIRCLFAVSNLGTKFDIDMLRKKANLQKLQDNFKTCCNAIKSTIDNIQKYCRVSSSNAIGGSQNFVPFVYYLFYAPKHQLIDTEIDNFRKSLFLFSFAGSFSRYADSRLGKFIRDELKSRVDKNDYEFPLSDVIWWINYWERLDNWNADFIQRNSRLAMYIIQQDSGLKTHYKLNSREMDHIFPRSKLREKKFNEAKINHFANFWILSKTKNLNKSSKHPKAYFEDVPQKELKAALINKELLDYKRYNAFIKERENAIIKKLTKRTGISETDFEFLYEE